MRVTGVRKTDYDVVAAGVYIATMDTTIMIDAEPKLDPYAVDTTCM